MLGKAATVIAFTATACGFSAPPITGDGGSDDAPSPMNAPPGLPLHLTATPGDTEVSLTWDPPASAGSSPITGYVVTTTPDTPTLPSPGCMGTFTACTITGLTDGATYTFALTATNAFGASTPAVTSAMPFPAALASTSVEIWLDAAASGTQSGAVTSWTDRSSHLRPAEQPTGAEQPVIDTVNNLPGITFDGTDDYLVTTPFVTASTPYTVFVTFVERGPTIQANHLSVLYATRACGGGGGGGFASWTYNSFGGNTTTRMPGAESPDATLHQAAVDGAALIPVPNGGGGGPMTAIPPSAWSMLVEQITLPAAETTAALFVGAQRTLCAHGNVTIGELIIISGLVPGSAAFTAIQDYLQQRWRVAH